MDDDVASALPLHDARLRRRCGEYRWGSFTRQPERHGSTRYRLVVYPPRITAAQRRWLRLWGDWPVWGAALWVACLLVLPTVFDPPTPLGVATLAYLSGGMITFVVTRDLRAGVHTVSTTVAAHHGRETPCSRRIVALADELRGADDRLSAGDIAPGEYEAVWRQVYQGITPDTPAGLVGLRAWTTR